MESVKGIIDKYGLANVNDKVNGVTALHSAVAKGSLEMVKLLIENGASPNTKIGKTLDTYNDNSYEFYVKLLLDPNSRLYRAECSVPENLICLGNRNFLKLRPCNWTGGYKWTTALALSITLGGFGADR